MHPVSLDPNQVKHGEATIMSTAMAFGTIVFACGGAGLFPTIQHDMKNTAEFPKAVLMGYVSKCECIYHPEQRQREALSA